VRKLLGQFITLLGLAIELEAPGNFANRIRTCIAKPKGVPTVRFPSARALYGLTGAIIDLGRFLVFLFSQFIARRHVVISINAE